MIRTFLVDFSCLMLFLVEMRNFRHGKGFWCVIFEEDVTDAMKT